MNAGWMGTTANVNLFGWGIAMYDRLIKLSLIEDASTFITAENSKSANLMGYGGNGHNVGDGLRNSTFANLYS